MAHIRPFRGVRYNPAVVGDLRHVISPPYDVISPEQQTLLHLRSPYNAIHLDLNQTLEPYTGAARAFREWMDRGVLMRDPVPALYCYVQEFALKDGIPRRRVGIFAALRLEEFSSHVVRPHERTFEHAKQDRLALLRACQVHLSPIFFLYSRPGWSVEQVLAPGRTAAPLIAMTDDQQVAHRLWQITDQHAIAEVAAGLASESLIIADGHHRYETALRYRQEMAGQGHANEDAPFNYVLAYLTNAQEDGVVILPTHRLVNEVLLPPAQALRTVLHRDFRISLFPLSDSAAFLQALRTPGPDRRIGCVLAGAGHYWLLSFTERITRTLSVSAPLRDLDVTVLHELIFQQFLGLTPDLQQQKVAYTIDEEEALRRVAARQSQAAFLLNPTTFAQIAQACEAGETMPQKSTYFFPKLPTGLVFLPTRE
jgi:uncharacterized protein (DUF1015 family)